MKEDFVLADTSLSLCSVKKSDNSCSTFYVWSTGENCVKFSPYCLQGNVGVPGRNLAELGRNFKWKMQISSAKKKLCSSKNKVIDAWKRLEFFQENLNPLSNCAFLPSDLATYASAAMNGFSVFMNVR